jgi:hypothetical protein
MGIILAVVAVGGQARAQAPAKGSKQADRTSQERGAPREMRTMQVEGGTIRYEVLPDDDKTPPGEVFVVSSERAPAQARQQPPPAEPAQAMGPPPGMMHGMHPPHDGMHPPHDGMHGDHGQQKRADACRAQQAKLAERLLELQGLYVPADMALWLQRNPTFYAYSGYPVAGALYGPTLATMIQSDLHARTYAEDLARCQGYDVP